VLRFVGSNFHSVPITRKRRIVTQFLDTFPFDWSQPAAQELRKLLVAAYPMRNMVLQFVNDTQVPAGLINWEQPMQLVWHDVISAARGQDKLRDLLQTIAASGTAPVKVRLDELLAEDPVTAAPSGGGPLGWKGSGDRDSLERQIAAESTLLDVAFLKRGTELAPAIARLLVTLPSGQYYGTGFRIGDDMLLTNHHVLYDESSAGTPASTVEAWFGYERDFGGGQLAHTVVAGMADSIKGDKAHDWAVVRMATPIPPGTPTVALTGATPVKAEDRVYIIQHPNGGVKKIGMIHNVVRFVDDNVVQYWTDTEGGSSGSPVFNEKWELVALHHRWVEDNQGAATEYRNQGQRIERVVEGLAAAGVI